MSLPSIWSARLRQAGAVLAIFAAVVCFAMAGATCLGACMASTPPNVPTLADVGAYEAAQMACVSNGNNKGEIDACRWGVFTQFCTRFPALSQCASVTAAEAKARAVLTDGGKDGTS